MQLLQEFPWYPKAMNELNGSQAGTINEAACLIYFSKEDEASVTKAKAAVKPSSDQVFAKAKADGEDQPLFFFYAKADEELIGSLTEFAGISTNYPQLAILDVPSQAKYVCDKKDLGSEDVSQFVDDFLAGKLQKVDLH